MKRISLEQLPAVLGRLRPNPRVVASGNFATPAALLNAVDQALPEYILHILNAQKGIPQRSGVTPETAFVGPGMRRAPNLQYVPCRLSLVPVLLHRSTPRTLLCCTHRESTTTTSAWASR